MQRVSLPWNPHLAAPRKGDRGPERKGAGHVQARALAGLLELAIA